MRTGNWCKVDMPDHAICLQRISSSEEDEDSSDSTSSSSALSSDSYRSTLSVDEGWIIIVDRLCI